MAKRNVRGTAAKCWPLDWTRLEAYLESAQADAERCGVVRRAVALVLKTPQPYSSCAAAPATGSRRC